MSELDSWDNAYSACEKLGLEQVLMIDYSSGCYEFDCRVIWRHKETGVYYTAKDSGCSCPSPFEDYRPSPFEDYRKLEDLHRLDRDEVVAEALEISRRDYYDGSDVELFIRAVRDLPPVTPVEKVKDRIRTLSKEQP